MINYGYFRHRFDAHESVKLNKFIDDVGVVGYGYYYTLLEIYGAKIAHSDTKESADIHIRTVANVWRKRVDSCHLVLTKLQLSGLLVLTKIDSTYTIAIPNYLKYYGSYKKTDRPVVAKKRKEKKRKEKESKVKETPLISADDDALVFDVIQHFNSVTKKSLNPKTKKYISLVMARKKEGYKLDDFKKVIDIKNHQWAGDEKMSEFIRPATLFAESHFDDYLNQDDTSMKAEIESEQLREKFSQWDDDDEA